jgi:hypothetical protein
MSDADIRFYFDPVCPFAWMTSKWMRMVAAQRDYAVDWRFISLRMINSGIDYDSHFPAGYEEGHTSGLRLLRVAARARAEHGRAAVGPFKPVIDEILKADLDAPRKQRHTITRIHHRLLDEHRMAHVSLSRGPGVDAGTGVWGLWMPGFMQFFAGVSPDQPRIGRLGERALGIFRTGTGLWLMYLTFRPLNFILNYNLPL